MKYIIVTFLSFNVKASFRSQRPGRAVSILDCNSSETDVVFFSSRNIKNCVMSPGNRSLDSQIDDDYFLGNGALCIRVRCLF